MVTFDQKLRKFVVNQSTDASLIGFYDVVVTSSISVPADYTKRSSYTISAKMEFYVEISEQLCLVDFIEAIPQS